VPSLPGTLVRFCSYREGVTSTSEQTMEPVPHGRRSRAWEIGFTVLYAALRVLDPLIQAWWRLIGLGNVVRLTSPGRRSGRPRSTLLGLLVVDGRWYVGHPNGPAAWTRNLAEAHSSELWLHGAQPVSVRAVALGAGSEREAVIRATWTQHPFPGGLIYSLARRHVRATGRYFRLEALAAGSH
jgi:hypothetical protein